MKTLNKRLLMGLVFGMAVTWLFLPMTAQAGTFYNVGWTGVVIKGYDPVAYFTEKMPVKGEGKSELYQFLTAGGLEEPSWNFTKYLVGRDGKVVARFAPRTAPDDAEMRKALQAALDES